MHPKMTDFADLFAEHNAQVAADGYFGGFSDGWHEGAYQMVLYLRGDREDNPLEPAAVLKALLNR